MEFYGSHEEEVPVTQVLWLPGLGRLVTLTENNSLHLWETQGTQLVRLKSTHLDGRLKQFTQLCLDSDKRIVHLGTEGGNIYRLNLWTFEIDETIVYQASLPSKYSLLWLIFLALSKRTSIQMLKSDQILDRTLDLQGPKRSIF